LLLGKLHMPYYIVPGNHDIRWSEPQATNFATVFRADKFTFTHKGYQFIGFTTTPPAKPGNGIIKKEDIDWMKIVLEKAGKEMPVFAVTHYPLQKGDVDNWKDATDVLKRYNILAVLGGHYHRNVLFNYDGIPGIVCRSALRAKNPVGGYSIFSVSDSIKVSEKRIGQPEELWLALPIKKAP
jgi:3',5'-cyclic AMP phosphodiesterase CpdA